MRAFLIALIPFVALFAPPLYRDATRDKEVAKLVPIMGLLPGMNAADVGAGEGRMTVPLADLSQFSHLAAGKSFRISSEV